MNADVVVDVGNTRIKWGLCRADRVAERVSLPHDDEAAWSQQAAAWGLPGGGWALAGVAPGPRDRLAAWLRGRGADVLVIDSYGRLPLVVDVEGPEKVGLDRLLNAVAANAVRPPGRPAFIIDAGTAVTVDFVDGAGAFGGGVIFPGLRLMARALHQHTALLPEVAILQGIEPPGRTTQDAIAAGVFHAVVGGIRTTLAALTERCGMPGAILCTGGDAPLLAPHLREVTRFWPALTLEGIRLSALEYRL